MSQVSYFLSNPEIRAQLLTTQAQCVESFRSSFCEEPSAARPSAILSDDPYLCHTSPGGGRPVSAESHKGCTPVLLSSPSAHIGADVTIGPLAVVEAGLVWKRVPSSGRTACGARARFHRIERLLPAWQWGMTATSVRLVFCTAAW